MATEAEIAWAAGVFEGEGSIIHSVQKTGNRGNRSTRRALTVKMCDLDVLQRMKRVTGAGNITGPTIRNAERGWRPQWAWQVTRWDDVQRVLTAFLPYLCERRTAKAVELLADPPRPIAEKMAQACCRGHERTPENLYLAPSGARVCRPCQAMHQRKYSEKKRHDAALSERSALSSNS